MSYCYMDDVCGEEFRPEDFVFSNYFKNRKMNGGPYRDPDSDSKKLYEDLKVLTSIQLNLKDDDLKVTTKSFKKKQTNETIEYFVLEYKEMVLGSDYIGPSSYRAFGNKFTNQEIGECIKRGRILGGHILWPKEFGIGIETINQAKGKSWDRMDICLFNLKEWYEGKPSNFDDAFTLSSSWLKPHKNFGFKDFIETFALQDFVDLETLYPYDLSSYDAENNTYQVMQEYPVFYQILGKENYQRFVEGNLKVIEKRDERLQKLLDRG